MRILDFRFWIDSTDKSGGLYHHEILGQADPDRGQKQRGEYWEKVNNLEPENGVYILLLSRQNSVHPDIISVIWVKNQSP